MFFCLFLLACLHVTPVASASDLPATSRLVQTHGPVVVGQPMPSFAGWNLAGDMVRPSDLLKPPGQTPASALVVSMFTTWCAPCRVGMPVVDSVAVEGDSPVRTLFVAVGQNKDEVTPFTKELGVKSITLPDPYKKLSARLGVDKEVPRTFVVNGAGIVTHIFEVEGADFEARLKEAVGQ